MGKRSIYLILALLVSLASPTLEASKAPYSAEQLIALSEIIAVGEICCFFQGCSDVGFPR